MNALDCAALTVTSPQERASKLVTEFELHWWTEQTGPKTHRFFKQSANNMRRGGAWITAMVYFVIVVSIFISAEFLLKDFLDKFIVISQAGSQVSNIIVLFSFIALGAVSLMLIWRLRDLQSKARTTFLYLGELEGIKMEGERFDKRSQQEIERYLSNGEIERYFNNGDWTLAEYWVKRILKDYDNIIKKDFYENFAKKA